MDELFTVSLVLSTSRPILEVYNEWMESTAPPIHFGDVIVPFAEMKDYEDLTSEVVHYLHNDHY